MERKVEAWFASVSPYWKRELKTGAETQAIQWKDYNKGPAKSAVTSGKTKTLAETGEGTERPFTGPF